MPKPIINSNFNQETNFANSLSISPKTTFESPELAYRRKRSQQYIDILKGFDILGHNITQDKINSIINAIKMELPELSVNDLPIGIVAKCYLGEPYEVHTLSLIGGMIIEHYKQGQALSEDLEKARTLANNENYAFIEVYKTKLIAIKEDGTASIINDKD